MRNKTIDLKKIFILSIFSFILVKFSASDSNSYTSCIADSKKSDINFGLGSRNRSLSHDPAPRNGIAAPGSNVKAISSNSNQSSDVYLQYRFPPSRIAPSPSNQAQLGAAIKRF